MSISARTACMKHLLAAGNELIGYNFQRRGAEGRKAVVDKIERIDLSLALL
jgi:hypothetical protein